MSILKLTITTFLKDLQNINNIMSDKETLTLEVYQPIAELKQKFYECKSQADWDSLKVELKGLLAKAEKMMDGNFYTEKYKPGVVQSIEKIYGFKQKQFSKKQFVPPVKVSYIFQENLADALTRYIELQTKLLELEYEAKTGILLEKQYA